MTPFVSKYTIRPITPDASLEDLDVHGILPAIAADLDEARDVLRWATVQDIADTVERLRAA